MSSAAISSTVGMLTPLAASTAANAADTTMNSALRMLLAAMARERNSGAERDCTSAYSGTM
ncbi:hypothetical protein D3C85_1403770 [compost metagenome]